MFYIKLGLKIKIYWEIRMKSIFRTIPTKVEEKVFLWDAFIYYLEIAYFPGVIEALDSELLALEYENFKHFAAA